MKYLGTYQSKLSSWHYQELVKLLEAAIEQGEFAGGKAFDQSSLKDLEQQGQDFGELPVASAGQRVTDDSINRPLALLRARFAALLAESNDFESRAQALLEMLKKDSSLIDQLLFAAALERWAARKPRYSQQFKWDFGMGHGAVAPDNITTGITPLDPVNYVEYPSRPPVVSLLTDALHTGLAADADIREVPVKYMNWTYTPNGQVEELYGDDWTKLSFLTPEPLVHFTGVPIVDPYPNPFIVTGSSKLGGVPLYVRTGFTPRRNQLTCRVRNTQAFALTRFRVSTDDVHVSCGTTVYDPMADYLVDAEGTFIPLRLDENRDITIHFVEYFPSYECSINQQNWSPTVMMDAARPYPDFETNYRPIAISGNTLPITDELGNPTGLYIQLGVAVPKDEWTLRVANQADPGSVGASAMLELEFARPSFLNAVRLAPFTNFPLVLKRVEVEGLTGDTRQTVYEGSAVLDRSTLVRFTRRLVRRVFLTFYQENYSLKDHEVDAPDNLRREVMAGLQAALPYNVRRTPGPSAKKYRGAQYEFGLESLQAQDWTFARGVHVAGPFRFTGIPEVIRLDADVVGHVDFYLCFRAYDSAGQEIDVQLQGVEITPGTSMVFPFANTLTRSTVARTDVYVKVIHREELSLVERMMVQVSNV